MENKIRSQFLFEFSRNLKVVVRHIIHPSPNKEKTKRESRRYIFKSKQHLQGKQQFHSSFEIKQMQAMDLHDSIPNASYDMMYCKCHHLHFTHHVSWMYLYQSLRLVKGCIEPKSCLWPHGWHLGPLHRLLIQVFSVNAVFPYLKSVETGCKASLFSMRLGSKAHNYQTHSIKKHNIK